MLLTVEQVVYDYAKRMLLVPYVWGGNHPLEGVDCSGLALELLRASGLWPHGTDTTAQGLRDTLVERGWRRLDILREPPDFGALAFYGRSVKSITHVAFCLNGAQMIEAGGGGSKTRTPELAAEQGAYVRIRPIRGRSDLIEVIGA